MPTATSSATPFQPAIGSHCVIEISGTVTAVNARTGLVTVQPYGDAPIVKTPPQFVFPPDNEPAEAPPAGVPVEDLPAAVEFLTTGLMHVAIALASFEIKLGPVEDANSVHCSIVGRVSDALRQVREARELIEISIAMNFAEAAESRAA